jgi:hypothetical protein
LRRTVKGELITTKDKKYAFNTNILIDGHLHSNCTYETVQSLRVTANTSTSDLYPPSTTSSATLPLTIENGPPGVNKNYLLTSILQPHASFLGNYPHGVRMRHIQGLLMKIENISLDRCIGRRNINVIESGSVCFRDLWGNYSKCIPFSFEEGQEKVTI